MLFWGFALVVGLLLTPQRGLLLNRWSLYGGLIAFALVLPFILWNAANSWASFQYWVSYSHNHSSSGSPIDFLVSQILVMNPFSLPLWGAGLWFFFSVRGERYRVFGWAFVILFVLFALLHSKSYFLTPAYLPLYAGGGLVLSEWMAQHRRLVPIYAGALALSGLALAPGVLPMLPPANYSTFYGFLASSSGAQQASGAHNQLPQILADRFGWEALTAQVSQVYHALPADEQHIACIYANNYGEAGALYQFGDRYHLPTPISGHNAFYIWGPRGCSGEVIIAVGMDPTAAARSFDSVTIAAQTSCVYCVDYENGVPILVLRHPKAPTNTLWKRVKHFS
jgi:hypothetical protein